MFGPTEFVFRCKMCDHSEAWTTDKASASASIWHIYREHQEWWAAEALPGQIPPPSPELFGTRFEEWERQS